MIEAFKFLKPFYYFVDKLEEERGARFVHSTGERLYQDIYWLFCHEGLCDASGKLWVDYGEGDVRKVDCPCKLPKNV